MITTAALIEQLKKHLPDILADTPVQAAYLYGSYARNQALPNSDVDVALVTGDLDQVGLSTPQARFEFEAAVEAALEKAGIPNPDVRLVDDLPLPFRGQVATEGVRLYSGNEDVRVAFETQTWQEYFDFKPVIEQMQQALFERVTKQGL